MRRRIRGRPPRIRRSLLDRNQAETEGAGYRALGNAERTRAGPYIRVNIPREREVGRERGEGEREKERGKRERDKGRDGEMSAAVSWTSNTRRM